MSRIAEALKEAVPPGDGAPGECEGSRFHSPTPLLVYVEEVAGTTVRLCGNCRDNLGVFSTLMNASNGSLPWEVRREFGNSIRDLGMRAWIAERGARDDC